MKKKRLGVALVLLLLLFSMPSISIAKSNENEIKNQSNDIYLPEKSKELEAYLMKMYMNHLMRVRKFLIRKCRKYKKIT